MPSLFKKFGTSKKNNPYQNPHHPGHNPIPALSSTKTTTASSNTARSQSQPALPPRPASPRGSSDFLAEARSLAGRDPVTGRPLRPGQALRTGSEANVSSSARVNANANSTPTAPAAGPSQEPSAYTNRASQTAQTTGSKYDLFVKLMAEKKIKEELEAGKRWKESEYYAPERRIEEFYSGGVRD